MQLAIFLLISLIVTPPAWGQRNSHGIFFGWGAFSESAPRSCFAVAKPQGGVRPIGWQPFASIAYRPGRVSGPQLHVRLSREKRNGSALLLRIDGRSFQLAGGGVNAWAPNPRADAAIVAAMRTGVEMRVETRSTRGARVIDRYPLRGAASAIDAAAIACVN